MKMISKKKLLKKTCLLRKLKFYFLMYGRIAKFKKNKRVRTGAAKLVAIA